jgi:uncharacterized membrane protein YbhN (UPF0104 family)
MLSVTFIRNMLVDIVPFRAGELSYIALLNRGYRVSGANCVSSLAGSFFFDVAALALIFLAMIVYYFFTGKSRVIIIPLFAVAVFVASASGFILFVVLKKGPWMARAEGLRVMRLTFVRKTFGFLVRTAESVQGMRARDVLWKAVAISLGVRACKYTSFYFAFLAVTLPFSQDMARTPFADVLFTLFCAEGVASLPVPSFMSFGPYEAGGLAALTLLGFTAAHSMLAMLAMHITSQVVDYLMGLAAVLFFVFAGPGAGTEEARPSPKRIFARTAAGVTLLAALAFFSWELRGFRKMGAVAAPPPGQEAAPSAGEKVTAEAAGGIHGFILWSSNRFGNHDILRMDLPSMAVSRITEHPFAEYYPRISPDGRKAVFCRSQSEWVSQRDNLHWDVYLIDLETREETLIASQANTPTWSRDGRTVYFQYREAAVAAYRLEEKKLEVVFEAGRPPVPEGVFLTTPDISPAGGWLAVTLRGRTSGVAVISPEGGVQTIDDGCQMAWSGDGSFLYYIGYGGKMRNAVFRCGPDGVREIWLDLPEPFSHEYFPRMDNTGQYLVLCASSGGHEHDTADYEIFLWKIGSPPGDAVRMTFHTGNDNWPDLFLNQ